MSSYLAKSLQLFLLIKLYR